MPLSEKDWHDLLAAIPKAATAPLRAMTMIEQYDTISFPIRIAADNGAEYVAKCPLVGMPTQFRRLTTERVLAGLAFKMGFPVVEPVLIAIGQDFLEVNPDIKEYIAPGFAHGTRFIPGCIDARHVLSDCITENKSRLSDLAIFYGWGHANDPQFLYQTSQPRLIHSVDHGEFLPSGASWERATLDSCNVCEPYSMIVDEAFLLGNDLVPSRTRLAKLTDEVIAQIVGDIPLAWWSDDTERIAMCAFAHGGAITWALEGLLNMSSIYHIVQYAPNPMAGERVNVGIIIVGDGRYRTHFVENTQRLKCLAGADAVKAVRTFAKTLPNQLTEDFVEYAAKQWRGCIQLTKAHGSLHDADFLLHDLAGRLLVDPPPSVPGHLLKHDVQQAVKESLTRNLRSYLGGAGPLLLKSEYRGVSQGDRYQFDFAVVNGSARQFVQALSFQVEATKRIEKEVNSAAWSIQKVRATSRAPITVVAAKPNEDQKEATDVYENAVKTYEKLDAEVVPHLDVEGWAKGVAAALINA